MNIFANIVGTGGKKVATVTGQTSAELGQSDEVPETGHWRIRRRTGRTEVYAVRQVGGDRTGEVAPQRFLGPGG